MLSALPARDQSIEAWSGETFAALARMPVGGPEPVVWPFAPYYTGNPFQAMLYGRFADHGLLPAPAFRAQNLAGATRDWPPDLPLVVHLHWLNQVLAKAQTPAEAETAVQAHTRLLDQLKARGARLVWTVHNVLPHDSKLLEQEVRLRQQVIERADLVHVMSPRTVELAAAWFELPPDRLYQCDHPGYQGVYPDWVSRTDARRRLRLPEGALVLLMTGALKPYKRPLELLDALDRVAGGRPGSLVLLVAGRPDDAPETAEFIARAARHPAVRLLPGQVADADVQLLMRACDVVALPYRRSLNSGVLALALTFGRPVLLPSDSGSVPLVDGGAGLIYPADEPDGLLEAVRGCLSWDLQAAGLAAAAAGARIDREAVTARFAADLRRWVDTPSLVPAGLPAPGPLAPGGPLAPDGVLTA